ncbi:MAG: FAD-dependent oxidoreductase [Rudaea sp.]|nr:FAD-dependent oxidoreductase [Rudaea sp.]
MSNVTTTLDQAASTATHSDMHPRHDQTFPELSHAEIDRLRRFGTRRHFHDGEYLFQTGRPGSGMYIVLSGHVAITQRDGLGHVTPVVEQGPGQFLAEVGQLSNRAALVDGHAEGEVETLLIPPEGLRALLIAEADLGERIMRALILRRVSLIRSGLGGPVLIGSPDLSALIRLQGFLDRNGYPYHLMDPAEPEAATLIDRHVERAEDLPLVVCPDGSVLKNPSEPALARQLGMIGAKPGRELYDVAIVGCGPAGLSTAVYAASEGLSVVVLDLRAFGGQAGASARIENYLGFPTGISGQALTARAFVQAQKFGAEMMIPLTVKNLDCSRAQGAFALDIGMDTRIRARAVVVASGARYRRLAIDNLQMFEGHGVWYWASQIEARLCAGNEVVLVGGGNSAGQAAVFLSAHVAKVLMMVRGDGLARTMSRYLIDRIEATSNIEVMTQTEVVGLEGSAQTGLERVRWRNNVSGKETTRDIRHVFLFVGADPSTAWLEGCGVQVDKSGFIVTGAAPADSDARDVHALESSVPGVFAVGDVRSGSVKRVGAAIGEGAQAVQALHRFLESVEKPSQA